MTTDPLHKEEGESAEPAQEAEAEAKETTQIVEDGPHPTEAEVAEADQLEGQDNKTCNEYRRKENENYKKVIIKQRRFCVDPYLPTWQNMDNYIGEMTPTQLLARPTNIRGRHPRN